MCNKTWFGNLLWHLARQQSGISYNSNIHTGLLINLLSPKYSRLTRCWRTQLPQYLSRPHDGPHQRQCTAHQTQMYHNVRLVTRWFRKTADKPITLQHRQKPVHNNRTVTVVHSLHLTCKRLWHYYSRHKNPQDRRWGNPAWTQHSLMLRQKGFFWYKLTQVVPEQRPLNGGCC